MCARAVMLQVAANARGIQLVSDLIEEYGLATVQAYMGFIQVCPLPSILRSVLLAPTCDK